MLSRETLSLLRQIADGIAAQFGPSCEIVVHDLTDDLEHTVVHIENGQISGRALRDGPSHAVLEVLRAGAQPKDHLAYLTRTPDGKILKSSTIYIKDEAGKPTALFAINYDISAMLLAETVLHEFTTPRERTDSQPEKITHSVSELLSELIEQSVALVGKPVPLMDRDDKMRAVRFLSDSGALLITKSGDKIAKYFGISKYTLYSYLDSNKEEAQ
ncbi:Transcriptional regulator DauR [bioreactor metagenome]|uniref:Transcriptional regulator DauR n=1 Tax=bioreactor metagenome TaxID=1076179 RepID=A0A645BN30_9ZZZZ